MGNPARSDPLARRARKSQNVDKLLDLELRHSPAPDSAILRRRWAKRMYVEGRVGVKNLSTVRTVESMVVPSATFEDEFFFDPVAPRKGAGAVLFAAQDEESNLRRQRDDASNIDASDTFVIELASPADADLDLMPAAAFAQSISWITGRQLAYNNRKEYCPPI